MSSARRRYVSHRWSYRRQGQRRLQSALSHRRANSVKDFLIKTYHVDGDHLSAIGFGEEHLKNKDNPFADENRRVQIVNTGNAWVAEGKPAPAPGKDAPAQ